MSKAFILITFLMATIISFAQEQKPVLGWLTLPEYAGWVNDLNDIFSAEEELVLNNIINEFEARTTVEIAVVTLDTTMANAETFDSFSILLGNAWAIGKKDKNNGILIAISIPLRMMRINTGYGIEKTVTNQEAKMIIDSIMIPNFKKEQYFEGTKEAIRTLIRELE